MAITEEQFARIQDRLLGTFFATADETYRNSPAFQVDLDAHVRKRYLHYATEILPWLQRATDGVHGHIVEVGSGTGASTAAFAPLVDSITCFETNFLSVAAARARMEVLGLKNIDFRRGLFEKGSVERADGVLLAAVLEHCTFAECQDILRNAWDVLSPGGWLCVVDTPNRFAPVDYHTAWLPFYSALPIEVRVAYARYSTRERFTHSVAAAKNPDAVVTRWGCGISYHEFELALSPQVHEWIVADGWEQEIVAAINVLDDDRMLLDLMKRFAPNVNQAFARRALYLVIRKP